MEEKVGKEKNIMKMVILNLRVSILMERNQKELDMMKKEMKF